MFALSILEGARFVVWIAFLFLFYLRIYVGRLRQRSRDFHTKIISGDKSKRLFFRRDPYVEEGDNRVAKRRKF